MAAWAIGVVAVFVLAFAFRFGTFNGFDLNRRVLHGDEGVNAIKAGQYWHEYRGQSYQYDPYEFHGPTLPMLSQPILSANAQSIVDADERAFRLLTAFAGVLVVLLTLASAPAIGRGPAIGAALATALSAAMVFYSRYYIHEMLLVLFTMGALLCGWRYLRGPCCPGWAAAFGVFVGLMHATKETFIIPMFAMIVSAAIVAFWRSKGEAFDWSSKIRWKDVAIAVGAGLFVSILLFSNFFTNMQGPIDSILAYKHYLLRSGGHRGDVSHDHPFGWYLSILLFQNDGKGAWLTEAPILLFAMVGIVSALDGRRLGAALWPARFFALYTLWMVLVYSAIPYKTPWTMLGFLHGLCIMAGIGAVAIWRDAPKTWGKVLATGLILAAASLLANRSYASNFQFATDTRNPYVYAHASHEVRTQVQPLVEDIAAGHALGLDMPVILIGKENPWPLPYYLRNFKNIGKFPLDGPWPNIQGFPLVLCDDGAEDAVLAALGGAAGYRVKDAGLRQVANGEEVRVVILIHREAFQGLLAVRKARREAKNAAESSAQ